MSKPSSPPGALTRQPQASIAAGRLTLHDPRLFGDAAAPVTRRLLELAFSLPEITTATLQAQAGSVSFFIKDGVDPAGTWRRLGHLLRRITLPEASREVSAARLALQPLAPGLPVRISRFGQTLTTLRVRGLGSRRLRIAHPLLRDRHVKWRALAHLNAVHGVVAVRSVRLWGRLIIQYDPGLISPEHLLRYLDEGWAHLQAGPPAPPLPRRLALTGSLLAFSFTAQFLRNALLPWAAAAVLLYNSPNVIAAVRDLRRRRIGLPAMHTLGFAFLLYFRLPFVSSLISTLAQTWPQLATQFAIGAEKKLFAPHRRRQVWARLSDGRSEVEIDVAALRPGTVITARKGDYVAADGVVVEGLAAVREAVLAGGSGLLDKLPGDSVYAGSFIADGAIALRVTQTGDATASAALSRLLPHRPIGALPSLAKVEQIAHRNARPALAAAGVMLAVTRIPRYSQVIIRPDYVTGPRLSAHLSALTAVARSLAGGALYRNPAALDRVLDTDIVVLDDGVDFSRRRVQLNGILSPNSESRIDALRFAAAAFAGTQDPRAAALRRQAKHHHIFVPPASDTRRLAGAVLFRDDTGSQIRVLSPALALAQELYAPTAELAAQLRTQAATPRPDPATRSFAVARGRNLLGLVQFERNGALEAADAVAALRLEIPDTRFVYLSALAQGRAEDRAAELGLDAVFGGLSADAKTDVMRSMSTRAAWVGDGSDPGSAPTRNAAAVSISIAGIDRVAEDFADILLLHRDLSALSPARLAAQRRQGELRADYRAIYAANLAAVAGGFMAGFSSLHAGLTSNAGTAAVFLSRWRALKNVILRQQRSAATP